MMDTKKVSSKICLIGDGGVGKSSLIRRYVHNAFDDRYVTTIGTKVSRKDMVLEYPTSNVKVKLNVMIWDIMGQKAFRGLLREAYFNGANGIIAVCNLTNEDSLWSLGEWIDSLNKLVGRIPIVVLANKYDLKDSLQFGDEELRKLTQDLKALYYYTSAKTGENVNNAFLTIAKEMMKYQINLS
jgi:small GTP-binding protein